MEKAKAGQTKPSDIDIENMIKRKEINGRV